MKINKINIIISIFFALLSVLVMPTYVEAESTNIYINHATIKNMVPDTSDRLSECESVLGDINDESSVAWLLQKLLNYIKILGPTIALALGSIDFVKAIISSDDEQMKKTEVKFIKRVVAALVLFFIPLLVSVLLGMFGITTDNATCGLK